MESRNRISCAHSIAHSQAQKGQSTGWTPTSLRLYISCLSLNSRIPPAAPLGTDTELQALWPSGPAGWAQGPAAGTPATQPGHAPPSAPHPPGSKASFLHWLRYTWVLTEIHPSSIYTATDSSRRTSPGWNAVRPGASFQGGFPLREPRDSCSSWAITNIQIPRAFQNCSESRITKMNWSWNPLSYFIHMKEYWKDLRPISNSSTNIRTPSMMLSSLGLIWKYDAIILIEKWLSVLSLRAGFA